MSTDLPAETRFDGVQAVPDFCTACLFSRRPVPDDPKAMLQLGTGVYYRVGTRRTAPYVGADTAGYQISGLKCPKNLPIFSGSDALAGKNPTRRAQGQNRPDWDDRRSVRTPGKTAVPIYLIIANELQADHGQSVVRAAALGSARRGLRGCDSGTIG